ncbi:tetratricopeptide repeat protein [Sphingomonas sp. PP-CE-1G-424]|uniref:tetratricopeptide repeat protein n=1 Tax=Sphingomonas sp. PP-CE-1G-424 TaxID=2135658 RepID=UPI0010554735|nr:tetratricopeptide repeat protein [Sphingomonas sp. PP-CE-1G-424]
MAESIYPLLRRRRRKRRSRMPKAFAGNRARVLAIGLLCGVVVLIGLATAMRPAPPTAGQLLADSLKTLDAGNYSAARTNAQKAIAADPNLAIAHAVLARAFLELDDGVAAETELAAAIAAGFPADRLHQLSAHARLLRGDPVGAIAEAAQAQPRYAGYATRVRARALAAQGHPGDAVAVLQALLGRAPTDAAAWTDLGRLSLTGGDVGGATIAATNAVSLDRRRPAALMLQGDVVRSRYGLVAALPWFDAALQRDAYYPPALIDYAATLGDAGRNVEMLAATRRALLARPGDPNALYLQAVLAARAGRIPLAQALLEKTDGAVDDMPGTLLLKGDLDYAQGRFAQAAVQWRKLVQMQLSNVAARQLLGVALLRAGNAGGAIAVLRPIAARPDADSYSLTLIARALEAVGNRIGAATFLDRAAAAPVSSSPIALAGRPVARVVATPGAPAAQLALGDSLAAAGRYGDAARAYTQAADLSFDEPTMLRLVDALARAGRAQDSATTLVLYLSQNPQSLVGARMLGHRQVASGEWDRAIDTLESVRARVGNQDGGVLADLALAYAGSDDGAIAVRYGRAAYALSPMRAAAADAYGIALAANGDLVGARQLLVKATQLAPTDAAIAGHLRQLG